jgi:hypothetical protein
MEGETRVINKHKVTAVEHTNDCLLGYEEGMLACFQGVSSFRRIPFPFLENIYKRHVAVFNSSKSAELDLSSYL